MAFRLRLSHPLIIKLTDKLVEAGLARTLSDASDRRRRLIALTDAGFAEAERFERFSEALETAFRQIFEETGYDLFRALEAFEAAADKRSISNRIGSALQLHAQTEKL